MLSHAIGLSIFLSLLGAPSLARPFDPTGFRVVTLDTYKRQICSYPIQHKGRVYGLGKPLVRALPADCSRPEELVTVPSGHDVALLMNEGGRRKLVRWHAANLRRLGSIVVPAEVQRFDFSPDGRCAALWVGRKARVINLRTDRLVGVADTGFTSRAVWHKQGRALYFSPSTFDVPAAKAKWRSLAVPSGVIRQVNAAEVVRNTRLPDVHSNVYSLVGKVSLSAGPVIRHDRQQTDYVEFRGGFRRVPRPWISEAVCMDVLFDGPDRLLYLSSGNLFQPIEHWDGDGAIGVVDLKTGAKREWDFQWPHRYAPLWRLTRSFEARDGRW